MKKAVRGNETIARPGVSLNIRAIAGPKMVDVRAVKGGAESMLLCGNRSAARLGCDHLAVGEGSEG